MIALELGRFFGLAAAFALGSTGSWEAFAVGLFVSSVAAAGRFKDGIFDDEEGRFNGVFEAGDGAPDVLQISQPVKPNHEQNQSMLRGGLME